MIDWILVAECLVWFGLFLFACWGVCLFVVAFFDCLAVSRDGMFFEKKYAREREERRKRTDREDSD